MIIYIIPHYIYTCVKIISVQVPFMPIHIAIAICVVLSELLV